MDSGCSKHIAQMPVVLIPVHFDRDQAIRSPSCQRSVVLRPFLSADFMTGLPAIPGTDKLPIEVSNEKYSYQWYIINNFSDTFDIQETLMFTIIFIL